MEYEQMENFMSVNSARYSIGSPAEYDMNYIVTGSMDD